MKLDILIIRIGFILFLAIASWLLDPLRVMQGETFSREGTRYLSAVLGIIVALLIIAFEMRVRRATLKTLIGAAIGSILGIIGAYLIGMLISSQETTAVPAEIKTFITVALAFLQAATHAPQPMHVAASIARSASGFGTGIAFASGAAPARAVMNPPTC
jgi:hypothetical protein